YGYSKEGKLGYNKGYEGIKGDQLEGGHRVPFFIRWPDGKIQGGKDINELAAHVDLIPTLAGLCNLSVPENMELDGEDISPLLLQQERKLGKRNVYLHNRQDWRPPMDVENSCIIQNQWRLINGNELYDVEKDPKQQNNLAAQNLELVQELLIRNSAFLKNAKTNPEFAELPVHVVGNDTQQEIKLTIQHAIGEDAGIWKCEQVAAGMKNKNNTHALEIDEDGTYLISCRRWAKECPGPILGVPKENPKELFEYATIKPEKVRIKIANQILEKKIEPNENEVLFKVNLKKGKTLLTNDFIEGDETYGVYYTYISKSE
ncbi:MAG: sulfatase/phosphatase domain-containing protein, partial [Lutimonas sp.]